MTADRIETAEALDALPVGSVVRIEDATVIGTWIKVADPHPHWLGVEIDKDDGEYAIENSQHWLYDYLPAALLYRPDVLAAVHSQAHASLVAAIGETVADELLPVPAAGLRVTREAIDAALDAHATRWARGEYMLGLGSRGDFLAALGVTVEDEVSDRG